MAEAAYGKHCDLYADVLRVSSKASPQKIQEAYFARRKHLFQVLSRIEEADVKTKSTEMKRKRAEKQMDAVVSAVRILGDAELRSKYNEEKKRKKRKSPKSTDSLPELNDTTNSTVTDYELSEPEEISPRRKPSPRKARARPKRKQQPMKSPSHVVDDNDSAGSTSYLSEEGTFLTYDYEEEEEVELPKRPEGVVDRVRMEFLGALDDTSRSFEQVFNAFTLSEDDIDAVVRRIDKAKTQISQGKLPPRRR